MSTILLFRQVIMEEQLSIAFGNVPEQYLTGFNKMMGMIYLNPNLQQNNSHILK